MFPVSAKPALILFDPGATHSFISISFVVENEIPSLWLENPYVIESPGAKMKVQARTNGVEIKIQGVKFRANLLHLQLRDLDVILGMDWLYAHKAKVDCGEKIIFITSPDHRILRIRSDSSIIKRQRRQVFHVTAEGVTQVPVVREYADVFPEELPGEPPDREVEFKI